MVHIETQAHRGNRRWHSYAQCGLRWTSPSDTVHVGSIHHVILIRLIRYSLARRLVSYLPGNSPRTPAGILPIVYSPPCCCAEKLKGWPAACSASRSVRPSAVLRPRHVGATGGNPLMKASLCRMLIRALVAQSAKLMARLRTIVLGLPKVDGAYWWLLSYFPDAADASRNAIVGGSNLGTCFRPLSPSFLFCSRRCR